MVLLTFQMNCQVGVSSRLRSWMRTCLKTCKWCSESSAFISRLMREFFKKFSKLFHMQLNRSHSCFNPPFKWHLKFSCLLKPSFQLTFPLKVPFGPFLSTRTSTSATFATQPCSRWPTWASPVFYPSRSMFTKDTRNGLGVSSTPVKCAQKVSNFPKLLSETPFWPLTSWSQTLRPMRTR